eukprot:4065-Eustigmatos_ZCMA.PRE.1
MDALSMRAVKSCQAWESIQGNRHAPTDDTHPPHGRGSLGFQPPLNDVKQYEICKRRNPRK